MNRHYLIRHTLGLFVLLYAANAHAGEREDWLAGLKEAERSEQGTKNYFMYEPLPEGLAIVHACGLPQTSRSHFDAMYSMEVGQQQPPGDLFSGWLGRHLLETSPASPDSILRAVALDFDNRVIGTSAPGK